MSIKEFSLKDGAFVLQLRRTQGMSTGKRPRRGVGGADKLKAGEHILGAEPQRRQIMTPHNITL